LVSKPLSRGRADQTNSIGTQTIRRGEAFGGAIRIDRMAPRRGSFAAEPSGIELSVPCCV
jgi:hypothetical protein